MISIAYSSCWGTNLNFAYFSFLFLSDFSFKLKLTLYAKYVIIAVSLDDSNAQTLTVEVIQ
jgi:hypothetical protein